MNYKRNVVLMCILTLSLTGGIFRARADDGHDHGSAAGATEQSQSQTLEGEVLDMACYIGHGAQGEKHGNCARKCAKMGAPLGLFTADGSVYLLVNDHARENAYEVVKTLAGAQAKITGRVVRQGGISAIVVEKAVKK